MIAKAIIPVAGLGTRLRPLSAVVPKAMMPVPAGDGWVLPVLHVVLAEAKAAGAEEAAVVVSPPHEAMIRAYLAAAARDVAGCLGLADRGETPLRHPLRATKLGLPAKVKLIVQEKPLGFGHAVWLARKFVGRAPMLVMLGDHIQVAAAGEIACAAQVARAFARHGGAAMIGMQTVDKGELPRVGVAGGRPIGRGVYRCTDFIEKPGLAAARGRLRTPGLAPDRFLAHCGIYAFSPEIFDCLDELISRRRADGRSPASEVQLADAQSILLRRHAEDYYLVRVKGRAHDTGTPAGYAATWKAMLKGT